MVAKKWIAGNGDLTQVHEMRCAVFVVKQTRHIH